MEVPTRPLRVAPPAPEHPTLVGLVETAIGEGRTMLQAQVELIKLQAKDSVVRAAGAIVAFVVAIVLALYLGWWTFHTAEVAFEIIWPAWAASLITWGIILVLIIIFAAIGAILMKRAKDKAPNPKAAFEKDVDAVKEALEND